MEKYQYRQEMLLAHNTKSIKQNYARRNTRAVRDREAAQLFSSQLSTCPQPCAPCAPRVLRRPRQKSKSKGSGKTAPPPKKAKTFKNGKDADAFITRGDLTTHLDDLKKTLLGALSDKKEPPQPPVSRPLPRRHGSLFKNQPPAFDVERALREALLSECVPRD